MASCVSAKKMRMTRRMMAPAVPRRMPLVRLCRRELLDAEYENYWHPAVGPFAPDGERARPFL